MDTCGTALIGVDWGTSNLRVHRIGAHGIALDTRRSDAGILKVPPGEFEAVLQGLAGDWMAATPEVPVLACGMVGSRQGWHEAPYLQCPADLAALAGALAPVPLSGGRRLWLVPGACCRGEDGVPDVIRGEETKVVGAAESLAGGGLVCLPGTHAKWARISGGTLHGFRTAMSGEVYQVLLEHSILGRMARAGAPFSPGAFARGVARSGAGGGLLHHLFSARTLRLFDELSEDDAPSYLSGILVGADVRAMTREAGVSGVCVVGEGAACDAYGHALDALGVPATRLDADAALTGGLSRIASAAGLLEGQGA